MSVQKLLVLLAACATEPVTGPEPHAPDAAAPAPAAPAVPAPAVPAPAVPAPEAPTLRLNLNTATEAEFAALPGVEARMVHEFVEYRPYVSIQQFRKKMAKYVDAAAIARYETQVFVPVDPAASDAPTLQQLPGVDAADAQALIALRPYPDREAFVRALSERTAAAEHEVAKQMLTAP